jgi:hypothetical protein
MHPDAELLCLFALGEDAGTEDDRAHAQTCPVCAGQVSELHRVVALGRDAGAETRLIAPGQGVWSRIRDELALASPVQPPAQTSDAPGRLPVPRPLDNGSGSPSTQARRSLLASVKAAVTGSDGQDHELSAHAQLTPVEAVWSGASGTAELATDEYGRRLLQVALQADLPPSGVRQAWLVHRDDPSLRQTLGILDGPYGLWTVAHSIDLEQYTILDISQQGTGETGHSGHTIVRGQLTLVS